MFVSKYYFVTIIIYCHHQYYCYYYYYYFDEYYFWLSSFNILTDSLYLKEHKRVLRIIQNSPNESYMPVASFFVCRHFAAHP